MGEGNGRTRTAIVPFAVRTILRHRIPALIVLLAITALLCIQLPNIRQADPLGSMYPEDHPFLPALEAIKKMAPEPRMLVGILKVKTGDIYNGETVEKIDRITRQLMSIEGVLPAEVTSLTIGFDHYDLSAEGMKIEPVLGTKWPQTPEEFAWAKRRIAENPMGPGAYVSYDGTATLFTAPIADIRKQAEQAFQRLPDADKAGLDPKGYASRKEEAFQKNLMKVVREIKSETNDANHTLHFMGPELITAEMTAMGTRHIPVAASVMFLIVIVLLVVYFRTVQGVLIPVLTLVLSVLLGLGILALVGVPFNPMALGFPLILGLFSLIYSVLAVNRYSCLVVEGKEKNEAVAAAYGDPARTTSLLAAGLATLSLCISGVPVNQNLGILGLFWLVGTLLALFVLGPILHSFFPPPCQSSRNRRPDMGTSGSESVAGAPAGRGRSLVTLSILIGLVALGAVSVDKLEVGDNIPGASYIRAGHPWNQCLNLLSEKFMGPFQLLVYVRARETGGFLDPEAIQTLGEFSDYLKNQGGARESIAFDMMIQLARRTFLDGNPKWQTVPVSREQVVRLAGMVVEQGGVESFMDKTFTEATISPFFPEKDAERIDEYASLIQEYIAAHPSRELEFFPGGGLLGMTKAVNDGTRDTYPKVLAAAFGIVFVLGVLTTGSLVSGMAVVLALAAAQALLWTVMAGAGIPISMPLVPVSAACIGFGSVFGFPLAKRIRGTQRKEFPGNRHEGVFSEIIFPGILMLAATLPWAFIGMKFQSHMVFTAGITTVVQAIACAFFVPALINALKRRNGN